MRKMIDNEPHTKVTIHTNIVIIIIIITEYYN